MDPAKNKRVLRDACAALGIEVSAQESPHDLYAKVTYQRKMQKTVAPEQSGRLTAQLDEDTFKSGETQRLKAFGFEGEALTNELNHRWTIVRKSTLAKAADVIFIDCETSKNKELMEQFDSDNFRLLIREASGFHFASEKADGVDASVPSAVPEPKIELAPKTTEPSSSTMAELAAAAAMRRMQTIEPEKHDAEAQKNGAETGGAGAKEGDQKTTAATATTDATGEAGSLESSGTGALAVDADAGAALDPQTDGEISILQARAQFVAFMDGGLQTYAAFKNAEAKSFCPYQFCRILCKDEMDYEPTRLEVPTEDPSIIKQALKSLAEAIFPMTNEAGAPPSSSMESAAAVGMSVSTDDTTAPEATADLGLPPAATLEPTVQALLETIQLDASIAADVKNGFFQAGERLKAGEIDKETLMEMIKAWVGESKLNEMMKATASEAPAPAPGFA